MSRITALADLQGRKFKFNYSLTFNSNYIWQLYGGTSTSPAATYKDGTININLYSTINFMIVRASSVSLWQERDLAATIYSSDWVNDAGTIEFYDKTLTLTSMNSDGSYNYTGAATTAFIEWWNANTTEVFDTVEERYAGLFRDIAYEIRQKDGTSFKIEAMNYPARIRALVANGITPTGTITFKTNGTYDVTQYASAKINVPTGGGGITPEGTIEITSNGDHDVTNYATASVNVPIPDGYIIPTGQLSITSNGTHNAAQYETVSVNVPNVIPDGYIKPEGSISITENGTVDVTQYASATINVASSGGGGEDLLELSLRDKLTTYSSSNVTSVPKYAFYERSGLDSISLPNCRSINERAFYKAGLGEAYFPALTTLGTHGLSNMTHLHTVNLPECTSIGEYAFQYCQSLRNVNIPKCTTIGGNAFYSCKVLASIELPECTSFSNSNVFNSCYALKNVYFPKVNTTSSSIFRYCSALETAKLPAMTSFGSYFFDGCTSLHTVDLGPVTNFSTYTFGYCYVLTKVIIREGTTVPTLNANAFKDCYHMNGTVNATTNPDGLRDGLIYVPDDLVESYKAATNWSVYADQIKPLSELEG